MRRACASTTANSRWSASRSTASRSRAYSIVSPNYEEHLEFFSIKVQNGPLTSRLQHLKVGDTVLIGKKPTGTLVADNLPPGKTLWMLSTGTGLAPFMSIIRDPTSTTASTR